MDSKAANRLVPCLLILCGAVATSVAAQDAPYTADWESLQEHDEIPTWLRDAKFGIYTHWGVYSVPAYNNEHYIKHMHDEGDYTKLGTQRRHLALYGPLETFGYHDFIPLFKGEGFDAEEWAELFIKAGARFAGPVAEHHDGFAMWDSALTPFNARAMGPGRDVVGELERAIRRRGLKFIASFHHELNYTNVKLKPEWAGADPSYAKLYGSPMKHADWLAMWRDKCIEVVDKYHPDLIYHDAWLDQIPPQYLQGYLAHYFNDAARRGQQVTVSYKGEDLPAGVGIEDYENTNPPGIIEQPWLCDFSIGTDTWGYTEGMEIRPAREIVHKIVEVVAKNGTMLLNLSPKSDGTIPDDQKQVALKVGRWLWTFGEAVYETRPFKAFGETLASGERVFYTQRGRTVYALFLDWPGDGTTVSLPQLTPASLGADTARTTLLGLKQLEPCRSELRDRGLAITIPRKTRVPSEFAQVFRIDLP